MTAGQNVKTSYPRVHQLHDGKKPASAMVICAPTVSLCGDDQASAQPRSPVM
jgi:hypothetical protein